MGKKSDTDKTAAASVEMPATRKATKPAPAPEAAIATTPARPVPAPVITNGDGAKEKAAAKKKPAKKVVAKKAAPKKAVKISAEDIALRAYFISEHRQRHGLHGDEHSDWVEAERQLKAEQMKESAKKPAVAKKRA